MYNVLTFLKFRAIITIITVQAIITYQQNKNEHWWNFAWGKMKKEMTHDLQSDIISLSNSQKNY